MPTPTIPQGALYMAATTYTGNGSSSGQAITNGVPGASFQPDMVWIKSRSQGYNHYLVDTVRGFSGSAARVIQPNLTTAEETDAANSGGAFKSFNTNGFTVAQPASGWAGTNENGTTYVGWSWKAGGAAVTNTAGTISTQVSANTTSGFSVVTYTGNGVPGATVGHGLGTTPYFIIGKVRSTTESWPVFHNYFLSLGTGYFMELNSNGAVGNGNSRFPSAPTSSVISIGSIGNLQPINLSGATYVLYCWAPVAGYSAFGSYTGNGTLPGPFIYTGFRPRFVMIKRTDFTGDWYMVDTSRNPYNVENAALFANTNGTEDTSTAVLDGLSNGFVIRNASGPTNPSGGTCIYMAFAENPWKYANAR
jgi:hypothetical protein